ncbi:hypothetical protein F4778DRAFT_761153 [Xylariomycetidae sp. FL2044]|nr:hypothetical protein F4778DRAFT_761153 [Xylariomycetidae sp. FL2044]
MQNNHNNVLAWDWREPTGVPNYGPPQLIPDAVWLRDLNKRQYDHGNHQRAWRNLGLDSNFRDYHVAPLDRASMHTYLHGLWTAVNNFATPTPNLQARRTRKKQLRRIMRAAQTLYGYQNENWDLSVGAPLPHITLRDTRATQAQLFNAGLAGWDPAAEGPLPGVAGPVPPGPNPRWRGARIGRALWKIRGPERPTPNELAHAHLQVRMPKWLGIRTQYGFNVRYVGFEDGWARDCRSLPVPEDEDSLWNSVSYFVNARHPMELGKDGCAIRGYPEMGPNVKAEIWRYFVEVLNSNNPISGPGYREHPRFRQYCLFQNMSTVTDAEYGKRSLLRCLSTNRIDAGEVRRCTDEYILQIIADYYNREVVVFYPDRHEDPVYQSALPMDERLAWRVRAYGHPSHHDLTENDQIILVTDINRRQYYPVHDLGGEASVPTEAISGVDRWHWEMPWWPDAAGGVLQEADVAPVHLSTQAGHAEPWRPLNHPRLTSAHLDYFNGYKDISADIAWNGRMPRFPGVDVTDDWDEEIAPAPTWDEPHVRLGRLCQHVCGGFYQVETAEDDDEVHPPFGNDWRCPTYHSETVRKYNGYKMEIDRRDLRLRPLNVWDGDSEFSRRYLDWCFDE